MGVGGENLPQLAELWKMVEAPGGGPPAGVRPANEDKRATSISAIASMGGERLKRKQHLRIVRNPVCRGAGWSFRSGGLPAFRRSGGF